MAGARDISSIEAVQNSAFGAVLLWSFGQAYQEELIAHQPLLHLYFLVLPIVLHRQTLDVLGSTNKSSGPGKFVEKLSRQREDLMAIHRRALAMRSVTLESLSTGVGCGLLSVDYEIGVVRANDTRVRRPTESLKSYIAGADKLGRWLARVPSANAFSLLQVTP